MGRNTVAVVWPSCPCEECSFPSAEGPGIVRVHLVVSNQACQSLANC